MPAGWSGSCRSTRRSAPDAGSRSSMPSERATHKVAASTTISAWMVDAGPAVAAGMRATAPSTSRRNRRPSWVPIHSTPAGSACSAAMRAGAASSGTGSKRDEPAGRRASPAQVPAHSVPSPSTASAPMRSSGNPVPSACRWRSTRPPACSANRPSPSLPAHSTWPAPPAIALIDSVCPSVAPSGTRCSAPSAASWRSRPEKSLPTHSVPSASACRLRTNSAAPPASDVGGKAYCAKR